MQLKLRFMIVHLKIAFSVYIVVITTHTPFICSVNFRVQFPAQPTDSRSLLLLNLGPGIRVAANLMSLPG